MLARRTTSVIAFSFFANTAAARIDRLTKIAALRTNRATVLCDPAIDDARYINTVAVMENSAVGMIVVRKKSPR